MARQESLAILNNLIDSLVQTTSSSSSSYSPPHQNPSLQSYYQQGSFTLLNHLIAEIEFSLGCATSSAVPSTSESTVKEVAVPPTKSTPPEVISSSVSTATTTSSSDLTINSLDIRIGLITKVSRHETAEKLYCEEIDVGEEVPRPIASGLVPYYSLNEMENRRVLVVCNLKPRALVGFKSNGMVLCASSTDHDGNHKVELIHPPQDAVIGSRIIGENLEFIEPLTVKQCDKQKAFQVLASDLKVNNDGIVVWKDHALIAAGVTTNTTAVEGKYCTAPTLRNCSVA